MTVFSEFMFRDIPSLKYMVDTVALNICALSFITELFLPPMHMNLEFVWKMACLLTPSAILLKIKILITYLITLLAQESHLPLRKSTIHFQESLHSPPQLHFTESLQSLSWLTQSISKACKRLSILFKSQKQQKD